MEAAACTATASAPASMTTCPAAFRVASSGCPAGIGRVWAIVSSFLSLQDTPKPEGQRRLTSGMAPRRSRQAQRPFIASPWPGATRAR